jgi:hypothetical protein
VIITGHPTQHAQRPRLLDLFCGAGGCSVGYHRAGFDVVGVDITPQPNYPFEFVQGDALEFLREHGREFDVIHASPPCQANSRLRHIWQTTEGYDYNHVDMIPETRQLLQTIGKPYVIENVPGADLESPIQLCGSSFGLRVQRHRLFEISVFMLAPPCEHGWQNDDPIFTVRNHGAHRQTGICYVFGNGTGKGADWSGAMGIDWMTRAELSQAIPPAYTEYIGRQLMVAL